MADRHGRTDRYLLTPHGCLLMTMTPADHETGFVDTDDVRLFYRLFRARAPRPGAPPVIIVHGLSYISYDWIGIAARLAADRDVAAIDMRGFGESTWSPTRKYGLRVLAADLLAVADHLAWPRAVLMGHSMGGRVGLCAAAWNPARAAALVCVDFAPDVAAAGRREVAQRIGNTPDTFPSVDAALAYHGHPDEPAGSARYRRFENFLRPVAGGFMIKRDLHYRDTFRETLLTGKSPAPADIDLWALLAGLPVPSLFLRGSTSNMFAPETMAKVRDANPRARVLELAGSHDLMNDNPLGVAEAVAAFLRAI